MKILYRLGCLLLALIGLSAFDYSRVPYQTINPIKKVGMHFVQDTKNGSNIQNAAGNAENPTGNNVDNPAGNNTDNPAENAQNAPGNNMDNTAENTQNPVGTDSKKSLQNQLSEYLSSPNQYYLLAVGNRGSDQNMIDTAIYSKPDDTSPTVGTLQYHCAVLIDTAGMQVQNITESNWVKVELGAEKGRGYVKNKEIEIAPLQVKSPTNDVIRNRIIENSIKYIGLKFVRYGKSLSKGIDCSNFASQIYGQAGISIKTKPNGIKKQGVRVKESQALPGDIVYYYCNNGGGHVGIYMGNGFIINSAGHAGKTYPEGGVRICRVLYKDREKYEFIKII